MYKIFIFIFAAVIVYSNHVLASKLKGNSAKFQTQSMTLTESVEKLVETEKEFLILFSRHAAFYKFPKKLETTSEVRLFLKKLIKSKKRITVEIDPISNAVTQKKHCISKRVFLLAWVL